MAYFSVPFSPECIYLKLNLFNVVDGLSGDEKQPVVKFLRCALPYYERFSKGHRAAEGCNLKNI